MKKNLYELGATVDLSHNKLTELPDAAIKVPKLKKLDVSSNQISVLPDTIHNVFTLTWLSLADNQLEDVPREIGFLKSVPLALVCPALPCPSCHALPCPALPWPRRHCCRHCHYYCRRRLLRC